MTDSDMGLIKTMAREGLRESGALGLFPAIGSGSRDPMVSGGDAGTEALRGPSRNTLPTIASPHSQYQKSHTPPDLQGRTSQIASTSSSRSSVHTTQPASPTKFPKISKKSSSRGPPPLPPPVVSVRRTISLPTKGLRANLTRSPSCPMLWPQHDVEGCVNGDIEVFTLNRSLNDSVKSISPTKLPNIFNSSSPSISPLKVSGSIHRSVSLHSKITSISDMTPRIGGTERSLGKAQKGESSTMTSLSMPHGPDVKEKLGANSPKRRSQNPMLLPIRDEEMLSKRSGSKKNLAAQGMRLASEGTSGDSGVSVGCRPSNQSDSSAVHEGSDLNGGGWGPEVEVEMDDETLLHQDPIIIPSPSKDSPQDVGERKSDDNRTTLSAEKCREWLEGVSEDSKTMKQNANMDRKALKMPKIN